MAKKAPVKKSKRRLKRSVRRSLSAVLMITAIGVAAIPVPENRASSSDIMTIAAPPHTATYSYPTNTPSADDATDEIHKSYWLNAAMTTTSNKPEKEDPGESLLKKQGSTHPSLVVRKTSDDTWELIWQFEYFNENTVVGSGVVSKYNDEFRQDNVKLPYNITYMYDTVNTDEYDAFYADPAKGDSKEYSLKDPTSLTNKNTRDAKEFLEKYFNDAYNQHVEDYQTWKDSLELEDEPELKRSVSELSEEQKLEYYCDHNFGKKLKKETGEIEPDIEGDSLSGYVLVKMTDRSPGKTTGVVSSEVYIPRKKDNAVDVAGEVDSNGFKLLGKATIAAIGDEAFKDVQNVSTIELPPEIHYIGESAFEDSFIKSVSFDNVEKIGNRAFKNCTQLTSISMGDGTKVIGTEAFYNTGISNVAFPYSIQKIGPGAFASCKNLATVDFTKVATIDIYDYAFYNDAALTGVTFGDSVTCNTLGYASFALGNGGGSLTSFTFPKTLNTVASYIKSNAEDLKEKEAEKRAEYGSVDKDVLEGKLSGLGDLVLAGRVSLQEVTMPADLGRAESAVLPNDLLYNCTGLTCVIFPDDKAGSCGNLAYNPEVFCATVSNPDFYVRGPELDFKQNPAKPRQTTWKAQTGVSDIVPYVYVKDGKEYYEVSDGFYLLCIDNTGMLTSCTLAPDANVEDWNGELEIPSMVGNTKVTGIASGCFSDSILNSAVKSLKISDDSITTIADGVFQAKDDGDWKQLAKVYIGNSVTSIGANAFKDCLKLIDVTFASPSAGHEAFVIGQDAFKTGGPQLTFHGDIVEGYDPFEWATDPDNIIQEEGGVRVCYKSLSPTYLTVIYNPITDMVTLMDYPKYTEINAILDEEYAKEIKEAKAVNYNDWRQKQFYDQYSSDIYEVNRYNFVLEWEKISSLEGDELTAAQDALYASDLYGPWISPEFCTFMQQTDEFDQWKQSWNDGSNQSWGTFISAKAEVEGVDSFADWLFEPIVAYAEAAVPKAYYVTYPFDVTKATESTNIFFATTPEEDALVYNAKNIDIPAGVESIDVYGYLNDLTADGEKNTSIAASNGTNKSIYFETGSSSTGWDPDSEKMYKNSGYKDEEDHIDVIPGLFSGYYKDAEASDVENRIRGNDVITSVTMHSVKYLPDYAFDSCEQLNYVVLGEACADIGTAPFRGCSSLTTVGDNDYYTTANGIVYSKNSDGTLTIEECLAARGSLIQPPMVNISSDPNLGSVSAIKPGAFEDCDNISTVDFGQNNTAGLRVIPEDCFKNCDNLQTVVLPMTTNDIKRGAFIGANKLSNLTIYGKEVQISAGAFDENRDLTTYVRAYDDSAVERYVEQYGDSYKLAFDDNNPLGEMWQVSFYDQNYELIENLKDRDGNDLANPQYVEDGARAVEPQAPANTEDWTFEKWVGSNNVQYGEAIHEDTSFFAQGYSNSGMVDGKYPVSFYDGIDGAQVGPTQYIAPGSSAIAPAHPVHAGYTADGYSVSYENIQAATTIIMKYKPTATSSGGTNTPGTTSGTTTSNRTTSNTSSTSNTSNSSNTSSSNSTSSTSTSSDGSSEAAGKHTVTVVNGSGSGEYATGATVWIIANKAADGQQFSKWTTSTSGVTIASVSNEATSFVMPATDVTVTAEYTAAAAPASNTAGTGGNANNNNNNGSGSDRVDITKPGISNKDLATANVNGSTDNFVVKITETDEATRAVADALTNKYGSLDNILYYAMDISLYDSTGTTKISDTTGLTVDITIPIPDALVAYGGNNMAGAVVNGNQLESLNESFTAINGVPCIRFTATHFSPYTVYVDTGNLTEGMIDTTPKTGDPIHPKWFLSIGLACLSVILFMKKDKGAKVKTA